MAALLLVGERPGAGSANLANHPVQHHELAALDAKPHCGTDLVGEFLLWTRHFDFLPNPVDLFVSVPPGFASHHVTNREPYERSSPESAHAYLLIDCSWVNLSPVPPRLNQT